MQQYSKSIAATLAGAVLTVIIPFVNQAFPFMAGYLKEPTYVGALQTILTAVAVYFAPANQS